MPEDFKRAYLAGLIDGEGYVGVIKRMPRSTNRATTPKYTARLAIQMTRQEPLRFLMEFGVISDRRFFKRTKKKFPNRKDTFVVDLENDDAIRLAVQVLDFIILKKEQLMLIIKLRGLQQDSRLERTEVSGAGKWKAGNARGHSFNLRQRSKQYLDQCEAIYLKCKELNKRGR